MLDKSGMQPQLKFNQHSKQRFAMFLFDPGWYFICHPNFSCSGRRIGTTLSTAHQRSFEIASPICLCRSSLLLGVSKAAIVATRAATSNLVSAWPHLPRRHPTRLLTKLCVERFGKPPPKIVNRLHHRRSRLAYFDQVDLIQRVIATSRTSARRLRLDVLTRHRPHVWTTIIQINILNHLAKVLLTGTTDALCWCSVGGT